METQQTILNSMFPIPAFILDDLCSRFIINIPEEERQDLIRIFFQIELAHWFYLDFYCQDNAELKACGIKEFSKQVFHHCPTLIQHADNADKILALWKEYKMAVPTFGSIMLDPTMQYCVLVQGYWAKASWGFPKGKINEDELPHDCAVREVLEETGFDLQQMIKEEEYIEYQMNEQLNRLYIVPDVPTETHFEPRTRKEIKKIDWFPIEHLPAHKKDTACKQHFGLNPNAFFMVIPFVKNLRKWIARKKGELDGSRVGLGSADGRPTADKHKQKQRQQFAQQMQSELQEYLQHKDPRSRSAGVPSSKGEHRTRSASPTNHGSKSQKGQSANTQVADASSQQSSSSQKKNVQILKRDGTTPGNARRTLAYDDEHSSAYRQTKTEDRGSGRKGHKKQKRGAAAAAVGVPAPAPAPAAPAPTAAAATPDREDGEFFSPTWADFKLDIDAVMHAMFPEAPTVG